MSLLTSDGPCCLAYFYCSRSSTELERSDPEAILRSILRQILTYNLHRKGAFDSTAAIYRKREKAFLAKGLLHLEESIDFILRQTCQSSSTTIVIDALDECDIKTRHNMLSALSSITQKASGLVKVFISSRDEKDITPRLKHLPNHCIKASDNAEDTHHFVKHEMEQAIAQKRLLAGYVSRELAREIVDSLTRGAQGTWVTTSSHLCEDRD